jgi:hypothetical protein
MALRKKTKFNHIKSNTRTNLLHQNQKEGLQKILEYPLNSDVIPVGTLETFQLSSPKAYSLFTRRKNLKCQMFHK